MLLQGLSDYLLMTWLYQSWGLSCSQGVMRVNKLVVSIKTILIQFYYQSSQLIICDQHRWANWQTRLSNSRTNDWWPYKPFQIISFQKLMPADQPSKSYDQIKLISTIIQHQYYSMESANQPQLNLAQERNMLTPNGNNFQLSYHSGSDQSDFEQQYSDEDKETPQNQLGASSSNNEVSPSSQYEQNGRIQENQKGEEAQENWFAIPQTQEVTRLNEAKRGNRNGREDQEKIMKEEQQEHKIQDNKFVKEPHQNFKVRDHPVDSKYLIAIYHLFLKQIKGLVPPGKGFIQCNPSVNHKSIKIGYADEQLLQQIEKRLEQFIDNLQTLEIPKKDAESGVLHSLKYKNALMKQQLVIFKDHTSRYQSENTYICGQVPKKELVVKLNEIRRVNFTWLHLFRFPDTRSYRRILRVIFEQSQINALVHEKFNAREIEVKMYDKNSKLPAVKKKGVSIILTIPGFKKLTIHQQIEEIVSKFIKETYFLFCFPFTSTDKLKKYVGVLPNVVCFFIHERHIPLSYIFFLVKQSDYKDVKDQIIKQLLSLKLQIRGIRYFKSFVPETMVPNGYKVQKYPKNYPYSFTVTAEKGIEFDIKNFFP